MCLSGMRFGIVVLGVFLIYQMPALGAGDLKLISIICLFFNWGEYLTWLWYSMLSAGGLALFYIIRRQRSFPFGVALFFGAVIYFLKS